MLFFKEAKNMDKKDLAKIYANEKYSSNQNTAKQISKRLNDIICIFEWHGVTDPTDADFENIIKPEITATKGNKGEQASASTVQAYLGAGKVFYQWLKMRGDNRMTENEISNVEEQNAVTNMEQADTPPEASINQEAKNEEINAVETGRNEDIEVAESPEKSTEQKRGRPQKTGREEKFTLYMTTERMNNLQMLSKAYKVTITDILNNLIDQYCEKNLRVLTVMKKQEEELAAIISLQNKN